MRAAAVTVEALRAAGVDDGWAEPIDDETLAGYAQMLSGLYAAMDGAASPTPEAEPADFTRVLRELADERG